MTATIHQKALSGQSHFRQEEKKTGTDLVLRPPISSRKVVVAARGSSLVVSDCTSNNFA